MAVIENIRKSIGLYDRLFGHSIKCLLSIRTSANPSLNFPTLRDVLTQPRPIPPNSYFILRYSTFLNLFYNTSILSYLQTKLFKARIFKSELNLEYSSRQTLHRNCKTQPYPTLPYRITPYFLLPYPTVPYPALRYHVPCPALPCPALPLPLPCPALPCPAPPRPAPPRPALPSPPCPPALPCPALPPSRPTPPHPTPSSRPTQPLPLPSPLPSH